MSYNFNEIKFLEQWQSTDFSTWNEKDVKEDFIAPLLKMLGYSKNTVNNISREKSLSLSEPYQRVGRQKIFIDYVPTIRLKAFWIIEAKSGKKKKMGYGDLLQAYLYAIHPEIQAQYIVLINGWKLNVYDSLNISSWKEPIFEIDYKNCKEKFNRLKEILSAEKMLEFLKNRILVLKVIIFHLLTFSSF